MILDNYIVTGIKDVKVWAPVPKYERLNYLYCLKCFIFCCIGSHEAYENFQSYLLFRSKNNQQYIDFWNNESKWEFNEDKSQYVVFYCEKTSLDLEGSD